MLIMYLDFLKTLALDVFEPDIVVMEMESQLTMLQDFTNGLLREMKRVPGFNPLHMASLVLVTVNMNISTRLERW